MNRRAKIVCTLGPATATRAAATELIDAGMDVARLNFSHSTRAEHSALYGMVREIAAERGRVVGVLADLQGPKIRLGSFADGPVVWATGERDRDHDRRLPRRPRPGLDDLRGTGRLTCGPAIACWSTTARSTCASSTSTARHHLRGARRRSGQRPQGHLAARGRRQRSAVVGEGHRGSEVRPRARRRHGGDVVRACSRGGQARARHHGRGRPPGAGHRQTREARGGFGPAGDRRGLRRPDGGTR